MQCKYFFSVTTIWHGFWTIEKQIENVAIKLKAISRNNIVIFLCLDSNTVPLSLHIMVPDIQLNWWHCARHENIIFWKIEQKGSQIRNKNIKEELDGFIFEIIILKPYFFLSNCIKKSFGLIWIFFLNVRHSPTNSFIERKIDHNHFSCYTYK